MYRRFSATFTDAISDLRGYGNGSAVREACEDDFVSPFQTDIGIIFKNEFCVLCNFPMALDHWRDCVRAREGAKTDNRYDLTMILSTKETLLPPQDRNDENPVACTRLDDVSQLVFV